jgi:hypothetical protein
MTREPPFDGSPSCPACPSEVRDLHANVVNFLLQWDSRPRLMTTESRLHKKISGLRMSSKRMQRIVDKHFADEMHAHGRLPI